MEKLIREKIGKGYFASGYGRGFQSTINIWLINGYAYARHPKWAAQAFEPLRGELEGYIPVNIIKRTIFQVEPKEHQPYEKKASI
jgi:hypothetical protein